MSYEERVAAINLFSSSSTSSIESRRSIKSVLPCSISYTTTLIQKMWQSEPCLYPGHTGLCLLRALTQCYAQMGHHHHYVVVTRSLTAPPRHLALALMQSCVRSATGVLSLKDHCRVKSKCIHSFDPLRFETSHMSPAHLFTFSLLLLLLIFRTSALLSFQSINHLEKHPTTKASQDILQHLVQKALTRRKH